MQKNGLSYRRNKPERIRGNNGDYVRLLIALLMKNGLPQFW